MCYLSIYSTKNSNCKIITYELQTLVTINSNNIKIISINLSLTVFSGKQNNCSHRETKCFTEFSVDILLNFSLNLKCSNIVKLSCMVVGTEPSTVDPSINQLNSCFKAFFLSNIKINYIKNRLVKKKKMIVKTYTILKNKIYK